MVLYPVFCFAPNENLEFLQFPFIYNCLKIQPVEALNSLKGFYNNFQNENEKKPQIPYQLF